MDRYGHLKTVWYKKTQQRFILVSLWMTWLPFDWLSLVRSKVGLICDPFLSSDNSGSALWDVGRSPQSCRGTPAPVVFRVSWDRSDPSLWLDEKTMTDPLWAACMNGWFVFLPSFSVWQWFENAFSFILDWASVYMRKRQCAITFRPSRNWPMMHKSVFYSWSNHTVWWLFSNCCEVTSSWSIWSSSICSWSSNNLWTTSSPYNTINTQC